jgi:hypothetical protein
MNELILTNAQQGILIGALNAFIEKIQSKPNLTECGMDMLDEAILLKDIIKPIAKKQHVDYKIIIE